MRELTLLETAYLAVGLLLCLTLPMLLSFHYPQNTALRKSCLRIVWIGQTLLGFAGLTLLVSSQIAPYAAGFGLVSYTGCVLALIRRLHQASDDAKPPAFPAI